MKRLTEKAGDSYILKDSSCEDAIERLAYFENYFQSVEDDLAGSAVNMDELKADGKEKSVAFKEQFALKLTSSNILIKLKYFGIE